jgi:hypothetical protein
MAKLNQHRTLGMDGEAARDAHLAQFVGGTGLARSNGGFGHEQALKNSGDCRSGGMCCA